ncbi:prepilin-type N-terminal cleavage/methylation domain-containing protein [Vreelandella aquamarina]|uniref:Type IV pilus assembly protein PilE n=1 Tax=Vreelandella aquamarina TaxID=77097 RepID=A0A1N6JIH0_9GAMM|nr:prepilin-type N-terminal cleavage/methylation domain-containing protein [Halomonas meridiana]SIN63215.1 type IV pilus assembly protein PilE [Halomonas meridiana]SIN71038.1 type IV pilus assembly protein PilE [Halomonas meridiana]SIO44033.1 type IV pilus assembly protein PilE [Halomonas meridiana]
MTYGFNRRAGDYGKHQRGFTLIELLIAVVIIGIIASIAYPSYTRYVERSVRSDGQTALLQAASEMERCYSRDYTYEECDLEMTISPSGHYEISLDSESDSSYLLTASTERSDGCDGDLTLDAKGVRAPEACW